VHLGVIRPRRFGKPVTFGLDAGIAARVAPGAAPDLDAFEGRVILIGLMRSTGNAAELPVSRRPSAGPRASSSAPSGLAGKLQRASADPLERVGGSSARMVIASINR
jgi:hypothetical protein